MVRDYNLRHQSKYQYLPRNKKTPTNRARLWNAGPMHTKNHLLINENILITLLKKILNWERENKSVFVRSPGSQESLKNAANLDQEK